MGGGYVSVVFSNPTSYPSIALVLALILYSIQLYCDFAGYSEIACGLTNLFGFECIDNFKRPYLACDIRDFWRRWHISLSTWLRDYIYIPLGGSRCKKWRKWINVFAVFISCGIWHGNTLPFVLWGGYHGLLNNLTPKKTKQDTIRFVSVIKKSLNWILTIILVVFGWLLFRSESMSFTVSFIKQIVSRFSISYQSIVSSILPFTGDNSAPAYCLTLFIMVLILIIKELCDEKREKNIIQQTIALSKYELIWTFILFVLVILFGVVGKSNFLYAYF